MFDTISKKLDSILRKIKGTGIISEKNIEDALKDIRMSLLEADVSYKVVKGFMENIKQKAFGESVLKSLSPDQQFIKIVHDELVAFLGEKNEGMDTSARPVNIMLLGLQGSGKTTTAAKLAHYLKTERGFGNILLIGADTYRPAAKDQLRKMAEKAGVSFYSEDHDDAVKIAVNGSRKASEEAFDAAVFDTAGRLHIDDAMISELKEIKEKIKFSEILLVGDSMLGQESVNIADNFNKNLGITGIILTKADGDARGGAALSMKYATGMPVKFMGTGEKIERLEPFHPERVAGRILGMGDVVSLVEKVQQQVTKEDSALAEEKFRKASFTFEDFLKQMKMLKNMGPLDEFLQMIPGASKMGLDNVKVDEKELKHIEAMILSMTPKERLKPEIIEMSRRARIAKGSGTSPEKVNKLIKQFTQMKKMMKKMGKKKHGKMPGMPGGFPGMPF